MSNQILTQIMEDCEIPEHMRDAIARYVLDGVPPGGFLTAIFENRLYASFLRADEKNRNAMFGYAKLLEKLPRGCWDSEDSVKEWCGHNGLKGIRYE